MTNKQKIYEMIITHKKYNDPPEYWPDKDKKCTYTVQLFQKNKKLFILYKEGVFYKKYKDQRIAINDALELSDTARNDYMNMFWIFKIETKFHRKGTFK